MDKDMLCVDCGNNANELCEVCKRPVCKSCVKDNHNKNNFENSEPDKIICEYCSDVYWIGY